MRIIRLFFILCTLLVLACSPESSKSDSTSQVVKKEQVQLTEAQMEKMEIKLASKNDSRMIKSGVMAKAPKQEAFLSGMVYLLYKGNQIPGYGVTIEMTADGNTYPMSAKKNGAFGDFVPAGMYTVIIKNDGYQTLQLKDVALTPGLIRSVEVELAPE